MNYIVTKNPGEPSVIKDHPGDIVSLESLRSCINKQWLEVHAAYIDGVCLDVWCDEEGLLHDLSENIWHPEIKQFVVGPVVICGVNRSGDSIPLTKEMAEQAAEWLNEKSVEKVSL